MSEGSNWVPPGAGEPKKPEGKPKKPAPGGIGQAIIGLIIAVAFFYWWFAGDDSPSKPSTSTATVAERLAIIDGSQGQEAEYDRLLDSLTLKCGDTRIGVSDTAVRGTQVMQERRNVTMSALEFLVAMDGSIPDESAGGIDCTEIAAMLIALTGAQ